MFRQYYLPILIFLLMNYSCKCQDLETFVAPIVDNNGAPLVAIVNITNISSHIVRSIEMPIRTIINTTVECKVNEKLKEDIVSSKVLENVNNKFDALQQKMAEHIGDDRKQLTGVKQDIATFKKEMEERITREILDKVGRLASTVNTENKVMNEKLDSITATVNGMNLRVDKVAFLAYANNSPPINNVIKFDDVETNIGKHYSPLTGVFTAPQNGLYSLGCMIMSKGNNYVHYVWIKNDTSFSYGYADKTNHANSQTQNIVLYLKKGDRMYIKLTGGGRLHGGRYSYITGYLL